MNARSSVWTGLVLALILCSRLPFLDNGYGVDPDAWRVAASARFIAEMGEYRASRLPGFPVTEILFSTIPQQAAWLLNWLTAVVSVISAYLLLRIARRYSVNAPHLLALTFSFVPIVYIHSTTSMDYLWAMAFTFMSWLAALDRKAAMSGIFLGLATGCRITSAGLALPFVLWFFDSTDWRSSLKQITIFWISLTCSAAAMFIPPLYSYGLRFFTFVDQGYPSIGIIARTMTLDATGVLGSVALIGGTAVCLRHWSSMPREMREPAVMVLFLLVQFLIHPKEGAYLIPLYPFLFLIFWRMLSTRHIRLVAAAQILSSFVLGVDSADRPWSPIPSSTGVVVYASDRAIAIEPFRGPILNDFDRRRRRNIYAEHVLAECRQWEGKHVIAAGAWLPVFVQKTADAPPENEFHEYALRVGNVEFVDLLTPQMLETYLREKYRVWYLPSIDGYNRRVFGVDLEGNGAHELRLPEETKDRS